MEFSRTAITVAIMLAYAVPGYLLIKTKAVKSESISAFAKVLLYICQPCLSLYSFQAVTFTKAIGLNMLIFVGFSAGLQLLIMALVSLVFYKKIAKKFIDLEESPDTRYRVMTAACTFGNVGFLGVPLLEALLPQYPEAIAFSAAFIVTMNILCWTVGSFVLTGDPKYISIKKVVLNPQFLSLFITLPLFFTRTVVPTQLMSAVTIVGKMTTPLCMIILGMRFAASNPKEMFTDWRVYFTSAVKLVIFPMLAYLITHWLPVDYSVKATLFILACCPTASIVLSLSEIYNCNQKFASFTVLTSTVFSMISIPVLLLIL
jgi:predicted permease